MNSVAIGLLSEAGFQGREAEVLLRHLLSQLVTPSDGACQAIAGLGLTVRGLDPSLCSIPEIVRSLADAGLDEPGAEKIFGVESAPAMLALTRQVKRLEESQGS